jgi:hypothetical protein
MNTTLGTQLRKCVLVFFHDILVYSASYEDHLQHMHKVFQLHQKDQWKIKLSKCSFAQTQISYLGHKICKDRVATNSEKVSVVAAWHVPTNVRELRNFLCWLDTIGNMSNILVSLVDHSPTCLRRTPCLFGPLSMKLHLPLLSKPW